MNPMSTLGSRLKDARTRQRPLMSLDKVARRLIPKVTRQTVSNWEQDKYEPSLPQIGQMAVLYNEDPIYLTFGGRLNGASSERRSRASIKIDLDQVDHLSIRAIRESLCENGDGALARLKDLDGAAGALRRELTERSV